MKIFCALLTLFICTSLFAETNEQAHMVSGIGYTGIILTPAMVKASPTWQKLPADYKSNVTFWTPSKDDIAQAEKALSMRLLQDKADSQPGGIHFRNYYSPKNNSRDRAIRSDDDPIYEGWISPQSSDLRQYIGITTPWGKKALFITFLKAPSDGSYKNRWADQAPRIAYLPASRRFDIALLAEIVDG